METHSGKSRGFVAVGLHNPKNDVNVAAALRACAAFEASLLIAGGYRYRKSGADTPKAWRHMPFLQVPSLREAIPFGAVPVAVELCDGAESLESFEHPERAFYVFGAEDGGIPKEVLSWCPKVVQIPTACCLNLAATVNVVLYDRRAKELTRTRKGAAGEPIGVCVSGGPISAGEAAQIDPDTGKVSPAFPSGAVPPDPKLRYRVYQAGRDFWWVHYEGKDRDVALQMCLESATLSLAVAIHEETGFQAIIRINDPVVALP